MATNECYSAESLSVMKHNFNEKIKEIRRIAKKNCVSLSRVKYNSIIKDVSSSKSSASKKPRDYWLLQHYDVLFVGNNEKLIVPLKDNHSDVSYYVFDEELFDILQSVHTSIGHGGRDRMLKECNHKYKNITRSDVEIFLNFCEPCQQKQKSAKKGIVVKPMIFSELNSRCQVDLIDYQSHPDGKFKFIMVYQDHLTKFVVLKPLEYKRAEEVAYHLIDIFTLIGAPSILQSDNGREFSNKIVDNLKLMWPDLKIVHGKPRHSQSQGSVERANQDIENMSTTWTQDNKTSKWSEGLRFVQLMKNRAHHSGIKRSPYEALFGSRLKVGLTTSSLPHNVLETINDEEELQEVLKSVNVAQLEEVQHEEAQEGEAPDEEENVNVFHCVVCQNKCSGAHTCILCGNNVHLICGVNRDADTEGYGQRVFCLICDRKKRIEEHRTDAIAGLHQQAKRMKSVSDSSNPSVSVGSTVRVPVPEVDRGRGDARSILAIVLKTTRDGFYKLGTRNGILKQLYARSQFGRCNQRLIKIEEVPTEKEISLRSAATAQSTGTGQGFVKCSCKNKCQNNRCLCVKSKVLCQSKCHSSFPCCNK
jgi:hypothetical protein